MGAWGIDTFDNDMACDWAASLEDYEDLSLVISALQAAIDESEDYLDAEVASAALAACEVIARLHGRFGAQNAYSEAVDTWVRAHPMVPDDSIVALANEAIDAVLGKHSELRELWEEGDGDSAAWKASVESLRKRVAG
ncbi:MAG: DUF4259 domain-containing protein [Phycisphaerales bacterium]